MPLFYCFRELPTYLYKQKQSRQTYNDKSKRWVGGESVCVQSHLVPWIKIRFPLVFSHPSSLMKFLSIVQGSLKRLKTRQATCHQSSSSHRPFRQKPYLNVGIGFGIRLPGVGALPQPQHLPQVERRLESPSAPRIAVVFFVFISNLIFFFLLIF